jgi:protein required for attachment to host cells
MATHIHPQALILVGDGEKAIFLRNIGSLQQLKLTVERVLDQENPPTREQGTDRPGRSHSSDGNSRSAMEETDWHQLAEDRFAAQISQALYKLTRARRFDELIVVAPPKVLGELRDSFHKEVSARITAEIPKELTNHSLPEIEKLLASA